jgi:hypothetical protein
MEHNFLFATKEFHVPCLILKINLVSVKCLCLKNMLSCVSCQSCYKFLILGAKLLHDVDQSEVSYLEVDTWHGVFDMT